MKKTWYLALILIMSTIIFSGCKNRTSEEIHVISREDGSGTRTAFTELFGTTVIGEDGTRKDMTTKEAIIANKTDVMLINIAGDQQAIGYGSLGSLNDTVKALNIDGVKPNADNIKNGTYKISRPFNIATNGEASGLAKDFIDFILSVEGQAVVAKNYVSAYDNPPAYITKAAGNRPDGKIVVAGSSSVAPVMEKLKEAYLKINPDATIELQISDSTSGMLGVLEGTCDIGMASRELKESEKDRLVGIEIALDGIVVLVNNSNTLDNLASEVVREIFTGKILNWSEITELDNP